MWDLGGAVRQRNLMWDLGGAVPQRTSMWDMGGPWPKSPPYGVLERLCPMGPLCAMRGGGSVPQRTPIFVCCTP